MNKGLKVTISVLFVSLLVFSIPLSLIVFSNVSKNPYATTYYGELSKMHERLSQDKNNKIVFVGNSSVAFGTDSELIETELQKAGHSYSVDNFGLYGSIGTKAMLDLSINHINKDDIVVLSVEEYPQAMSTFMDPLEIYRATNGKLSMLNEIDHSDIGGFIADYPEFVSEKRKLNESSSEIQGVYKQASFNERCDLKNYPRDYNILSDGYDTNIPIDLGTTEITDEYIDMINTYASSVMKKGASIYYSFSPMNIDSIVDSSSDVINGFADEIDSKIDFPLLSSPYDSIYESGYFYDSNFHLNDVGMRVHSIDLINQLKVVLEDTSETDLEKPEAPVVPDDEYVEEDSSMEPYFEYQEKGNGYIATSLKDEYKNTSEIIFPSMHEGKPVLSFDKSVFMNNTSLTEITFQKNVRKLEDSCFSGCSNLKKITITQTNPDKVSVAFSLLDGTSGVEIYVPKKSLSSYLSHYFWGHYNASLKAQ